MRFSDCVDNGAVGRDALLGTVRLDLKPDTSGCIALWIDRQNVADMDWSFHLKSSALWIAPGRFDMSKGGVDALNDDGIFLGVDTEDFAPGADIIAGNDFDGIPFFDVHRH